MAGGGPMEIRDWKTESEGLRAQVARLEGELADARRHWKRCEQGWNRVILQAEGFQREKAAMAAALRRLEPYLVERWEQLMNCGQRPAAAVAGALLDRTRAALSGEVKVCTCTAPPMQPCGPNCKYPYTDAMKGE